MLIPIYHKEGQYYILSTKRTETVKYHKGQISFPGGAYQKEDGALLNTALRETIEEIGLMTDNVEVPIAALLAKHSLDAKNEVIDGKPATSYSFHYQDVVISGVTARILNQLLEILAPVTGN